MLQLLRVRNHSARIIKTFLLLGIVSFAGYGTTVTAATTPVIYVTASGNDAASGSKAKPVRTITRALAIVADKGTVEVAKGLYPKITDSKAHKSVTVHGAEGAIASGALLKGASGITFSNLDFNSAIRFEEQSAKQPAHHIIISKAKIDPAYTSACIRIVNMSHHIEIRGSILDHCNSGIVGPGRSSTAQQSTNITIADNTISNSRTDGIQFGDWREVKIARNQIINSGFRNTPDSGTFHPDAIQITGRSSNISIWDNRIGPGRSQGIMAQTDIGPVTNLRVTGNKIGTANGVAFQAINIQKLVVQDNTICGKLGGLWLRNADLKSAVISGNTIGGENIKRDVFRVMDGASMKTNDNNKVTVGACSALGIN